MKRQHEWSSGMKNNFKSRNSKVVKKNCENLEQFFRLDQHKLESI